jgi:Ca2+-binding RTX toxin-like protein
VTILDKTTTAGTATVGSGGKWSWSFVVGSSTRSLTAMETDVAGNKSLASSGSGLIGTSGANTLTSTAGNDLMVGGAGADTFSFGPTIGLDVIADFAAAGTAHDIIDFHGSSTLNSFANVLNHTTQVGSGVAITQGAGDVLTLNNVTKASLTAADFTFV